MVHSYRNHDRTNRMWARAKFCRLKLGLQFLWLHKLMRLAGNIVATFFLPNKPRDHCSLLGFLVGSRYSHTFGGGALYVVQNRCYRFFRPLGKPRVSFVAIWGAIIWDIYPPYTNLLSIVPLRVSFVAIHVFSYKKTVVITEHTLPETNSSPLKMDGWNTTFLLGPGLFSGAFAVSFRESIQF